MPRIVNPQSFLAAVTADAGRILVLARNACVLALVFLFSTQVCAQTSANRGATIQWEAVRGAGGYEIELMRDGRLLVKQRTSATSYTIDASLLSPGTYRIRISTLDRNQEVASNSPWIDIHVKEKKVFGRKYFYVAAGWSYSILLQNWNKVGENSPKNAHLYGAYDLFNQIGVDLKIETLYVDNKSDVGIVFEGLTVFSAAPGLYYTIPLNERFGVIVRGGAGLAYSRLESQSDDSTKISNSIDPLVYASAGLRAYYNNYFADTGLEFSGVIYQGSPFFDLKPYIRIGIRF